MYFATQCAIDVHLKTHDEAQAEAQAFLQHQVCNKDSTKISQLKTHMEMHKKKIYPCKTCGKIFNTKMGRYSCKEAHELEIIRAEQRARREAKNKKLLTTDKVFQCDVCDKVFSQQLSLRCHSKTHSLKGIAEPVPAKKSEPVNVSISKLGTASSKKLPAGWRRVKKLPLYGKPYYRVYIIAPDGKQFSSRTQLQRYLDSQNINNIVSADFSFTLSQSLPEVPKNCDRMFCTADPALRHTPAVHTLGKF